MTSDTKEHGETKPTVAQCLEWLLSHVDQGAVMPKDSAVFLPREYRSVIVEALRQRPTPERSPHQGLIEELRGVSAVEYNSHDIREHFASKLRKRLATLEAAAKGKP